MTTATETKERPILYSGPMIRALLAGTKTQTRRMIKPQPCNPETFGISPVWGSGVRRGEDRFSIHAAFNVDGKRVDRWLPCRYGKPGDRLWVRETCRETFDIDDRRVMEYHAGGTRLIVDGPAIAHGEHRCTSILPKWRPSIHMPRWASRITLEITDVRVQRLQEISDQAALAEGVVKVREACYVVRGSKSDKAGIGHTSPVTAFAMLWDEINGDGAWELNPWVWAVSFKLLSPGPIKGSL